MKKFLVIMLAMLWMSVAAFSQITISQEDYDKLLVILELKLRR